MGVAQKAEFFSEMLKSYLLLCQNNIASAFKDCNIEYSALKTIDIENGIYLLYITDRQMYSLKMSEEDRSTIFNSICDTIELYANKAKLTNLINSRLSEYSKFSSKPEEIIAIYSQLIIKAYRNNDNLEYSHGVSPVETDVFLLNKLAHIITDATTSLLDINKNILSSDEDKYANSWNYEFSHQLLPMMIFRKDLPIVERIFLDAGATFSKMFDLMKENYPNIVKIKYAVTVNEIRQGRFVLLSFPVPALELEALYIGIIVKYKKGMFKNTVIGFELYMLEKGTKEEYFLCCYRSPDKHINCCKMTDTSVPAFIDVVSKYCR